MSSPECCHSPPREAAQYAPLSSHIIWGESNGQFSLDRNHTKRSVIGERNPEALSGLTQPEKQPWTGTLLQGYPFTSESRHPTTALRPEADDLSGVAGCLRLTLADPIEPGTKANSRSAMTLFTRSPIDIILLSYLPPLPARTPLQPRSDIFPPRYRPSRPR